MPGLHYRGWLLHARRHHPASTEMYQTKFGSSREAKPRVRISHPSIPHAGTSPSLLIVRFWFDQVSPSLTASWHKPLVCGVREWSKGRENHGKIELPLSRCVVKYPVIQLTSMSNTRGSLTCPFAWGSCFSPSRQTNRPPVLPGSCSGDLPRNVPESVT